MDQNSCSGFMSSISETIERDSDYVAVEDTQPAMLRNEQGLLKMKKHSVETSMIKI